MSKIANNPWPGNPVAAHVIATLPDSLEQRARVLAALVAIIPQEHPQRPVVAEMLHALALQRLRQAELPGKFGPDPDGTDWPATP